MGWNRLGRHHGLVEVDYSKASLYHHPQLLCHELSLSSDPSLSICIIKFRDPYLLLSNVMTLVDRAILSHGDLPVRVNVKELSTALGDCHAHLL